MSRGPSAAELLKNITRDPNYVKKLQESDSTSASKSWDGRFTVQKMPTYDAVNDRFCKFNMRRRNVDKKGPAPRRTKLAANMLALSQGPKPVWGAPTEPQQPQLRNREPLPPLMGDAPTGTPLPGAQQPLGLPTNEPRPVNAQDSLTAQLVPQGQSVESIFNKSKQRVIKLWDELGVPEAERLQFAQHAMTSPTVENVQLMNDELQRLLERRNAAVQVEKSIEVREGFLYLLQELGDRFATTSMERERALRELNALLVPFRNASLDVVDAILRWREVQKSPTSAPYLWKGVSYMYKMSSDIFFLTFSKLGQLLDFELKNNPLLDPRKELDASTQAAGGLPPVRRAKDNARLKDLPRDRLDRAERALQEEAQRQQAMAVSRSVGTVSNQNPDAYVDEEAHLTNLVREEEEKQQLLIEEDAWLSSHQTQLNEKDKEESAAIKIQTTYRGFISRKVVKARINQRNAVVKMQTLARQFVAKLATERLRKAVRAAKKIQALQRGVSARTSIDYVRYRHQCALKIQRVFRGHVARQIADMHRHIRYSAINIQRVYRGHRVRQAVRHFLAVERHKYAVVIQCHWRGYLVRRNPCYNPRKVEKVVKLQAWARGIVDRNFSRQLLLERRAAIKLQAWWRGISGAKVAAQLRGLRVDRGWEKKMHLAVLAATKIQSLFRRAEARVRCNALRESRNDTLAAQAAEKMREEAEVEAALQQHYNEQAAKIQGLFRGHRSRDEVKSLRALHQQAVQIQRVVRGRQGRTKAIRRHAEYVQELSAMSVVPTEPQLSLIETTILQMHDKVEPVPMATPQVPDTTAAETPGKDQETAADTSVPQPDLDDSAAVDVSHITAHEDPSPVEEALAPATPGQSEGLAPSDVETTEATPATADATAPAANETAMPTLEPASTEAPQEVPTPSTQKAVSDAKAEAEEQEEEELNEDQAAQKIAGFMRSAAANSELERARRRRAKLVMQNRQVQEQETLYAVRMLQGWFRARLHRLQFVQSRLRHRYDIHGRAVRRQEENYAAGLIQGVARDFVKRQQQVRERKEAARRSQQAAAFAAAQQERTVAALTLQSFRRRVVGKASIHRQRSERQALLEAQAIEQERQYAALEIQRQTAATSSSASNNEPASSANTAASATFASADDAELVQASIEQEKEYATTMIQRASRSHTPVSSTSPSPTKDQEKDVPTEAEVIAQEKAFAVQTLQNFFRANRSQADVQKLRRARQLATAEMETMAVDQEKLFEQQTQSSSSPPPPPPPPEAEAGASSTTAAATSDADSLVTSSNTLEAPGKPQQRARRPSAINTRHIHKGDDATHVGFGGGAELEKEHKQLPKDAPLGGETGLPPVSEAEVAQESLKKKVHELEERLAAAEAARIAAEEAVAASADSNREASAAAAKPNVAISDQVAVVEPSPSSSPTAPPTQSTLGDALLQELGATPPDRTPCVSPGYAASPNPEFADQQPSVEEVATAPATEGQVLPEPVAAPAPAPSTSPRTTPRAKADPIPEHAESEGASAPAVMAAPPTKEEVLGEVVEEQKKATFVESADIPVPTNTVDDDGEQSPVAAPPSQVEGTDATTTTTTSSSTPAAAPAEEEPIELTAEMTPVANIMQARFRARKAKEGSPSTSPTTSPKKGPTAIPAVEAKSEAAVPAEKTEAEKAAEAEREVQIAIQQREDRLAKEESERKAALKIQSAQRQKVARSKMATRRVEVEGEKKVRAEATALQLQADEEARVAHEREVAAANRLELENRAAAVIQRGYKCYDARFLLNWKREERIQKRKEAAEAEVRRVNNSAAIRLQCWVRRINAKIVVRKLKKDKARQHLRVKEREALEHRAAITMQCAFRSYTARFAAGLRRDKKLAQELKEAEEKRLMEERLLREMEEDEANRARKEEEAKATMTMQLAWRSYNARFRKSELERQKVEKDEIRSRNNALELLQRVGCGQMERTKLSIQYSKVKEAQLLAEREEANKAALASAAQPVGRGYTVRTEVAVRATEARQAELVSNTASDAIQSALGTASPAPQEEETAENADVPEQQ